MVFGSFLEAFRATLEHLVVFGGHFGAPCGVLGGTVGRFEAFCSVWGLWGHFETLCGILGLHWGHFGDTLWCFAAISEPF